jgi:carbonic anhydrase/acetyltransferase-like protein (isoleucine patch superfamily)
METKAFIAPNATVVGDVVLEQDVSIWYGAVLRGDLGAIRIGEGSNIQDNCVLHEAVTVGKGCSIGHGAILHGCTIGDDCVIGMGAIVLNGAVIGEHCLVGAGALVTGKMNAPAGSLILGNPATVVKPLSQEQIDYIHKDAALYIQLAKKAFQ